MELGESIASSVTVAGSILLFIKKWFKTNAEKREALSNHRHTSILAKLKDLEMKLIQLQITISTVEKTVLVSNMKTDTLEAKLFEFKEDMKDSFREQKRVVQDLYKSKTEWIDENYVRISKDKK